MKTKLAISAAAIAGAIGGAVVGTSVQDTAISPPPVTTTTTTPVAVPGPEKTVTVIQQVNPPISPSPNSLSAVPPVVAGPVTTKGPWAGYTVWFVKWNSASGAVAYKLWIDGKLTGTQAATPGDTQGVTFAVRCGVKHTFNLQIQNAAGQVGPKRATATTFTPKVC